MKISYFLFILLLFFFSSCSEENPDSKLKYLVQESRPPSLVSSKGLFGQTSKSYASERESGILVNGAYVWETFNSFDVELNCNLFEEFERLSRSEDTGKGDMIFSPFERFFVIGDGKNKYYGCSIKFSDNTIKVEPVFPVGSDNTMFRSDGGFERMTMADVEFIEKFYPCIDKILNMCYPRK